MLSYATNRELYLPVNSTVKDYIKLMKPRVMSLVVFTGIVGMLLAPGHIHPFIAFVAILCITLGSGGAAAINMWYDSDIDKIMLRTQNRPIVTGNITPDEALAFGVVLSTLSVLLMAVCVNFLASSLLAFTILYYVFIYTMWLKRLSIQNIVVGGVAGALPPAIGAAAVTDTISVEGLILFLIILMWTPPHSWALALYRSDDYQRVNIPMMPVIKGSLYTKKYILFYSLLMTASILMPYSFGMSGMFYLFFSTSFSIIFLWKAFRLFFDPYNLKARSLFIYSIFYLFLIFTFLLIDKYIF